MAIQNIRNAIEGIYARLESEASAKNMGTSAYARRVQDKKYAHTITIKGSTFARAMAKAINTSTGSNIADDSTTLSATQDVIKNWKQLPSCRHTSVTGKIEGNKLIINRTSKNSSGVNFISKINKEFKDSALEIWKLKMSKLQGNAADTAQTVPRSISTDADYGFSHNTETNVANAALLNELEENILPEVAPNFDTTNMAKKILDMLGINWKQEVNPENGQMEWIISGELAGSNLDYQEGIDLGTGWEDAILDRLDDILLDPNGWGYGNDFMKPGFKASTPFDQQVLDTQVNRMVDYYKNVARARITGRPKKHKKTRRSGRTRNKNTKTQTKTTNIVRTAVPSMRRERGNGRQASTQGAAQLTQLKKYINSRLPAEVRRNMGRPALQNQTGRFSNSVQLLSLMEGKSTIMAKYTYLLSPYGTFENTGRKRWPLAYNPKTIIAKSIRNLAQGRIENKLTLRRV